jgi:hypothetical protein
MHPSSAMKRLDAENHQVRLLKIACARWGLTNSDGTALPAKSFAKRLALTEFTHGYNHFWYGDPAIAAKSFKAALIGRALPVRSAVYYLVSQGKRLLSSLHKRQ